MRTAPVVQSNQLSTNAQVTHAVATPNVHPLNARIKDVARRRAKIINVKVTFVCKAMNVYRT